MARVYYHEWIVTNKGTKLYPKAARKDPHLAMVKEVYRSPDGQLKSRHLPGVYPLPEGVHQIIVGAPPPPEPKSHDPNFNTKQDNGDGGQ